jgi:DNA-binding response OmpR family regulator/anti-sigma regulatory factor (Ser/Thr protein kinase)
MHRVELVLNNENLPLARQKVEDWVGRYNEVRLTNLILITSELVTNLLKHANRKTTVIRIDFMQIERYWVLDIYDDGDCFLKFEEKIISANEKLGTLQVSGMGLGLVKALADDITYQAGIELDDKVWNRCRSRLKISKKPTIAIIDDDISILILLEEYLAESYRVLTFESGLKAIEVLANKQIDLIISDLNMPDIDGLQLRKSVQNEIGNIPFIFLTGERSEHLHRLAIDDVLEKPVHKKTLMQSIQRILIRHESLQQSIGEQLSKSIVNQLKPIIKQQPEGYQIFLESRAAKSGGGDFLFQHKQQEGSLLLLADVMGHDQQAKFFVHAYQGFLQGVCHGLRDCTRPEDLLYALAGGIRSNDLLASSLLTALSVYCAADGEVTVACAGHPAPLMLIAGEWKIVPVSGQLLGFSDQVDYANYRCPKGVPLLCFTDGLHENLSQSEFEELKSKIAQSISSPEPSLIRVMDYYDNKAGLPLGDDMTILVIIPE